jgi:hypothetical protein
MEKTFVNVTLSLIYSEIDQALESDLYSLQSELCTISHIRQEIANYALRRIYCRYRLVHGLKTNASSLSLEEALKVETIVRQGIQQVIHRSRLEAISPVSSERSSKLLLHHQALTPQL